MANKKRLGVAGCTLAIIPAAMAPAAGADPAQDAQAVVRSFNAAFGKKDIEGLVAHFIEGGVQFDLRPAHADQGTPAKLAEDLKERWYAVTPILFAATKSYTRTVEFLDTRATADMATVWTKTTSTNLMPNATKPIITTFREAYFLVHTPQGWKIGAMMDDRDTDRLSTVTPTPSQN